MDSSQQPKHAAQQPSSAPNQPDFVDPTQVMPNSSAQEATRVMGQPLPQDEATRIMRQPAQPQTTRVMPQSPQQEAATRVMQQPAQQDATRVLQQQAPQSYYQRTRTMPQASQQATYATMQQPAGEQQAYAAVQQPMGASQQPQMPPKKRNKGLIAVAIIAVVVILAAAGVLIYQKIAADQANEAEHAEHSVAIDLSAPGYDPATDSKIKVHIAGKDLDGKPVSQDVFIQSKEDTFNLLKGEYQLSFEASPLMASGSYFAVPSPVDFVIDDDNSSPTPVVTFTEADLAEVTDAQIDASYAMAVAGGMSESDAGKLRDGVVKNRDAAVEKAKEENEARNKRAEEEQRKAAYHVETADFEFDIPEYLWDKVNWTHDTADGGGQLVMVYRAGHPDQALFWVWSSTDSSDVEMEGDVGSHIVGYTTSKDGKYVGISSTNWAFLASYWAQDKVSQDGITEADYKALVPLSSGGKYTLDDVAKKDPNSVGTPDIDFLKSTALESLVAK